MHHRHGPCNESPDRQHCCGLHPIQLKETAMQWTTPAYTDLRFGFEITMYIANR